MSITLTDAEAAQLTQAIITWRRVGDQGQVYPADLVSAMSKLSLPGSSPVPFSGVTPTTTQATISINGHRSQK